MHENNAWILIYQWFEFKCEQFVNSQCVWE